MGGIGKSMKAREVRRIAFASLRQALAGSYCAHQALESDPLLVGMRREPEFRQIVQTAAECLEKFAAQ